MLPSSLLGLDDANDEVCIMGESDEPWKKRLWKKFCEYMKGFALIAGLDIVLDIVDTGIEIGIIAMEGDGAEGGGNTAGDSGEDIGGG